MFKYSHWKITFPENSNIKFIVSYNERKLEVLRIFDFDSAISMMSVIVRDTETGNHYVFSKGAPEKLQSKSLKTPAEF
jgi:magnesium-transporting ATPase (P-type)